ncbi:DgyrCDS1408 [Dimorphilus gyrociliatus]|uniref:Transporter n=1 Tax=Dimorphilus gyrociliatus TaxID=2664684 RepID=A0A7I8V8Q7_9ANNE|nr:DgyrCDS1408 [Dimorphilus gyrociliatus]
MTAVSTEDLAIRIDTLTNTVNRLSQNLEDSTLSKKLKVSKKPDGDSDSNSITFGEDENEERGNWSGRLDFLLSCLGYAVGLGNVWRFPYKCYQNGGGAFFIPYVIMLIFVGMPIFFLELSLGQFSSNGPLTCWKYSPMFTGVGWGMVIVSGFVGIYYNMIIAWSIYYLVASFTKLPGLPWDNCEQEWNSENCFEELKTCNGSEYYKNPNGTCYKTINGTQKRNGFWNLTAAEAAGIKKRFASEEYYYNKVLDISDGVDNLGGLKWELALCLLGAWVIVFLCLCKGVKSSGKVVYFTALFPYAVLVILFIRGMTLEGMKEGIKFYLTPDWDKLKKAKVWNDAANQIFFSLSASWGGLITLSSYNRFRNNLLKDTLIVSVGNCLTSVFAGFVIFSFLGYMAHKVDTDIDKVVDGGTGLAFVVYPFAVTQMPGPPVWAILFFLMLLTLGLDSQFALLETVTTAVMDRWPDKFDRKRKTYIILAVCVLFYLIGLFLCTNVSFRVELLTPLRPHDIFILFLSSILIIK